MMEKNSALYALLAAMLGGVLTAVGAKYVFPEWAAGNEMLMLIIMGAVLGLVCSLIWRMGWRNK